MATETRTRKKARQSLDILTTKRLGSLTKTKAKSAQALLEGADDAQWEMIFRIYDQDGDGHITSTELANIMKSLGKRPLTTKIQRLLDEMDTDHNGTVELEEFVSYMNKIKETKSKAKRSAPLEAAEEEKEKEKETPVKGRKRKPSIKKPKEEKVFAISSLLDMKETNGKKFTSEI